MEEQEFIDSCTARLLSDDSVADNLISQEEFALLLSDYCIEQGACKPGSTLDFENLSVEMQLAFVLFLCNEPTQVEQQRCLEELNAMGGPFGYDLQIEEREVLDAEIAELCTQAYEYASLSGLLAPTVGECEYIHISMYCDIISIRCSPTLVVFLSSTDSSTATTDAGRCTSRRIAS